MAKARQESQLLKEKEISDEIKLNNERRATLQQRIDEKEAKCIKINQERKELLNEIDKMGDKWKSEPEMTSYIDNLKFKKDKISAIKNQIMYRKDVQYAINMSLFTQSTQDQQKATDDGEVCSHVGALLFKIEMGVKMGLTLSSSTSKACQWNSTFRKEVIPATVTEICDKIKGKRTKEVVSIQADGSSFLPQPEVLDELYALVPNAAFFTSVTAPSQIVESQPVATYTEKYPKLLQSLQDPDISDINIDCHCKDIFSGYLCSDYQATN
ncbi:Hypothetical predicted protein [Mytilus galloprovincialis]|uniref:Uncharacterized protein n=1 Tax=Mytilus galloprovincialis TaxID=29158 RepID=A0A8B6BEN4_MYTGA|nr:Hypothetical predicted protein [Mytilus galloprovincialis]